MKKKNIYFVSLGCPKNLVDSEIMLGVLNNSGYAITDDPEKASIVIINTCGFISTAKEESINTILQYAELKEGILETLVVSGCMVQRYKKKFVKLLPEVDLFIGTNDYPKIVEYLEESSEGGNAPLHAAKPTYIHTSATPRILREGQRSAFLKIAEGCKNHCTYCIIPKLRGDFRSRQEDDILTEAKHLIKSGVIELNLIAQDTGSYGCDLTISNASLASLLKSLAKLRGLKWLRVLYLHPKNISNEVLDIIKSEPKIVKYIDLPIQHISSKILKLMNRHQTESEVREVIERIRNVIPDASLRTSLILGFPGETQEDFDKLYAFVKETRFDNLGAFQYSKEEGTKAFSMKGHLHYMTKKSRYNKILSLQSEISRENNQKYLGKKLPVLIEGLSEESDLLVQGRASFQAPDIDGRVYITDGDIKTGTIQNVLIEEAHVYDLVGKIV